MPRNISRFHATGQSLRNQVQLITYVDRLAGDLKQLKELLVREWSGLFGGVHLLPFFTPIDGADAGFDPVDHTEVDCRLGLVPDGRSAPPVATRVQSQPPSSDANTITSQGQLPSDVPMRAGDALPIARAPSDAPTLLDLRASS